jgi:phenol/toluene 2-monooxygenase (NADH) P0/A0
MKLRVRGRVMSDLGDGTDRQLDTSIRYVRERERDGRGFVHFDFAIGDPELAVELILPAAAFADFCRRNHAIRLHD